MVKQFVAWCERVELCINFLSKYWRRSSLLFIIGRWSMLIHLHMESILKNVWKSMTLWLFLLPSHSLTHSLPIRPTRCLNINFSCSAFCNYPSASGCRPLDLKRDIAPEEPDTRSLNYTPARERSPPSKEVPFFRPFVETFYHAWSFQPNVYTSKAWECKLRKVQMEVESCEVPFSAIYKAFW